MFDLICDKINVAKSKRKQRIAFIKHDWTNEISIPIIFMIFPIVWFSFIMFTPNARSLGSEYLVIHMMSIFLLLVGIYFINKNIQSLKLLTIQTNLSKENNRKIVLMITDELNVEKFANNMYFFRGIYRKSFPFKQIVTVIYLDNEILFNCRNAAIGTNGKIGTPPFGNKSSKKLFQIFKDKIEEKTPTTSTFAQ